MPFKKWESATTPQLTRRPCRLLVCAAVQDFKGTDLAALCVPEYSSAAYVRRLRKQVKELGTTKRQLPFAQHSLALEQFARQAALTCLYAIRVGCGSAGTPTRQTCGWSSAASASTSPTASTSPPVRPHHAKPHCGRDLASRCCTGVLLIPLVNRLILPVMLLYRLPQTCWTSRPSSHGSGRQSLGSWRHHATTTATTRGPV